MPVWEKNHLHLHKKTLRCRHMYTHKHMYTPKRARVGRLTWLDTCTLGTQTCKITNRPMHPSMHGNIQRDTNKHTHTHNRYVNVSLWVNMCCKLAHLSACALNTSHVACFFSPQPCESGRLFIHAYAFKKNKCTHTHTHTHTHTYSHRG